MPENKWLEMKISGMACAGCSGAVQKALSRLEGVSSAKVDLAKKTAYVDYDPEKITLQDLKNAVEKSGYKVV
ncbi:MAG: putative copper-exporting P-type ATPase A [Methanosaeta sp. PtaU1.Bin112]|nr:MAG: putative copper-exporting P-type ATPase A [Methanosaeta sp. PtaU1.Bin112]